MFKTIAVILLSLFNYLNASNVIFFGEQPDSTYRQQEVIYLTEKAIRTSSIVRECHCTGLERRKEEEKQLRKLKSAIAEAPNKDEKLKSRVIKKLTQDLTFWTSFNNELNNNYPNSLIQLRRNKMITGLTKALDLAKDNFWRIMENNNVSGYDITAPMHNIQGSSEHIYASGRGLALKILLLQTWLEIKKKSRLSDITLLGDKWLDSCPFVQITPLPKNFPVDTIQTNTYFFRDSVTKSALVIIHNGYTFGGQRGHRRYKTCFNKFAPEDCSSFVSKALKCADDFTTLSQALHYQVVRNTLFARTCVSIENFLPAMDYIKKKYQTDPYKSSLDACLIPVKISDPSQLFPGLIWTIRRYDPIHNQEDWLGKGGHTGIFLGFTRGENTQSIIMNCNRDLEHQNLDGAYLLSRELFYTGNVIFNKKAVFYTRPKNFEK